MILIECPLPNGSIAAHDRYIKDLYSASLSDPDFDYSFLIASAEHMKARSKEWHAQAEV